MSQIGASTELFAGLTRQFGALAKQFWGMAQQFAAMAEQIAAMSERFAAMAERFAVQKHLVYFDNGPVLLIRAEEPRVLFAFWRGKRLREIEPRLKPGGKYEMATAELRGQDTISGEVVQRPVKAAVLLNETLGDPTDIQ
jgi:hypothetical protein